LVLCLRSDSLGLLSYSLILTCCILSIPSISLPLPRWSLVSSEWSLDSISCILVSIGCSLRSLITPFRVAIQRINRHRIRLGSTRSILWFTCFCEKTLFALYTISQLRGGFWCLLNMQPTWLRNQKGKGTKTSVPNKLEPILIRCKPACISRSRPISETSSLTILILILILVPPSYIRYTGAGLLPYTLMLEFDSVTSNSKTDITVFDSSTHDSQPCLS